MITQYLDLISRPSVKINSKKIVVRLRKVFVTANIKNALSTAFKKANEGSISEFYDNLEEKVLNDKDKNLSYLEDVIKERKNCIMNINASNNIDFNNSELLSNNTYDSIVNYGTININTNEKKQINKNYSLFKYIINLFNLLLIVLPRIIEKMP